MISIIWDRRMCGSHIRESAEEVSSETIGSSRWKCLGDPWMGFLHLGSAVATFHVVVHVVVVVGPLLSSFTVTMSDMYLTSHSDMYLTSHSDTHLTSRGVSH